MIICLFSSSTSRLSKGNAGSKKDKIISRVDTNQICNSNWILLFIKVSGKKTLTAIPMVAQYFGWQRAFHLQVYSLLSSHTAMVVIFCSLSPILLWYGFQGPMWEFSFPCCYSHGLHLQTLISVGAGFQGKQMPQVIRVESPLLSLFFYHVVLAFSLHETVQ